MNLLDIARLAVADNAVAAPIARGATPTEAAELRDLVSRVLTNAGDADRAEALAVALADPEAALLSFRALAAVSSNGEPAVDVRDDRRTCTQCVSLTTTGRCLAAVRGELSYVTSRDYSPAPDVLKRCEGYRPKADDTDQRNGAQRWPSLINEERAP
jgi:hypothetical protein